MSENISSTTLGDLVELQRGFDLPSQDRVPGRFPVIGGGGPNGTHATPSTKAPGVVIGRSGSGIGNAWWCETDFWALNTGLYVKDFRGNIPRYVFHQLDFLDFTKHNSGGAQPSLNRNFIYPIEIRIPPVPEQRRIAAILDEWDKAIATLEKLVRSQQKRKGELIKSIFFGDANWFDASISELADVVGGGTPSTNKRAYWDGDIPWCTPTDITGLDTRYIKVTERTISETGLATSNATLLPVGSIILCSRASVGECAINLVPMATNQGFQSLVPKEQNDRYFLYYLVQAYKPELMRLSAGSTFMEFPKNALRTMNIRVPEAERRQEVGILFSDVDDELDQTVALLKRLRLQKRGLMQKLLSGDLPVPASIDRLLPGAQDIDEAVRAELQRAEATG